ncbi:MAG: VOC family protein [Cyanobacteria bacterium J06632_22]
MIAIDHLDHLVLTVRDIDRTCEFYRQVLGMTVVTFGAGRIALRFGNQKINLHQAGQEFEPKANQPIPGSADLCFITQTSISMAIDHIEHCGVKVLEGPVQRTGATGTITSVYIRDPDNNLIEISNCL